MSGRNTKIPNFASSFSCIVTRGIAGTGWAMQSPKDHRATPNRDGLWFPIAELECPFRYRAWIGLAAERDGPNIFMIVRDPETMSAIFAELKVSAVDSEFLERAPLDEEPYAEVVLRLRREVWRRFQSCASSEEQAQIVRTAVRELFYHFFHTSMRYDCLVSMVHS